MILENKKVIIFDLDGTLAVSKQPLTPKMAELLKKLLDNYLVAVISGGFFEQYQKQFLFSLNATKEEYERLILLPTSGTTMYKYIENTWKEIYCNEIAQDEKDKIISYLNYALEYYGLIPETTFGKLVEDRRTQITYSGLGQEAPVDAKKTWDPNGEKRLLVVNYLKDKMPNYSIRLGGMTSVDITMPGIDKAYGIRKLVEHINIPVEQMVFVGDALYEGGNDAPAKETGIECVEVADPSETEKYIESII